MKKTLHRTMAGLLALTLASLACGLLDSAVDTAVGGDMNFTSVLGLWSDVPQMDGLTASQMEMPVYVKAIMNLVIGNLGLLNPEGEDRTTGKVDWIVFDTDQTPEDVKAYYTPERMTENGWEQTEQSSCVQGSDFGMTEVGALCVFAKQTGDVQTQLAIITAQDEQTQKYHVFFLRLESAATATPTAAAQSQSEATVTLVEVRPGMDVSMLKVCELLPAVEVEKVLGRKLVKTPEGFSLNGANTDAGCSYSAGKDSANNAYFAYAVVAPTSDYAANRPVQPELVPGLGDEAFFINGPDARQLWVLLNGKAAIMVAIGDAPDEAGTRALATTLIAAVNR